MKTFIKIVLLLMAIFPIWLTIAALAQSSVDMQVASLGSAAQPSLTEWKDAINTKLLQFKDRRVQVTEILSRADIFDNSLLKQPFEIDLSTLRARGTSQITLKFQDAEGRMIKVIRPTVKVFMEEEVAVATRNLGRGEVIQSSDFTTEWRPSETISSTIVPANDLLGRIVRIPAAEGDALVEAKLERETLVKKGDRVRIVVSGDGISISGVGVAAEGGTKGQTIKVTNTDSKKEILGVIRGRREVEVRI